MRNEAPREAAAMLDVFYKAAIYKFLVKGWKYRFSSIGLLLVQLLLPFCLQFVFGSLVIKKKTLGNISRKAFLLKKNAKKKKDVKKKICF